MGLFGVVKRRIKCIRIINNVRVCNDDIISNHKLYRDYYSNYAKRSTPTYIKITDCLDDDSYTKITTLGRSHYNMLRRKFNAKKFDFKSRSSFRIYANRDVYYINGHIYRNMFKFK